MTSSLELISHGTVFLSHNKITSADLSAVKTITQTAPRTHKSKLCGYGLSALNFLASAHGFDEKKLFKPAGIGCHAYALSSVCHKYEMRR